MTAPHFILWREQDRPYVLLVFALALVFALLVAVFFVIFTSARVDGESMVPALHPEDRVLITRSYDTPRIGDIVSADIVTETGPDSILKRVIALPGDEVSAFGDVIVVNGSASVATPDAIIASDRPTFAPVVVPEGKVYLAGDNRPISYDSRFIGTVPLSAVTGRVVAIFSPVTRMRFVD